MRRVCTNRDEISHMRLLIVCAPGIFLLLWSGGFTVAKIGISDADPLTLLALRYACVVALLLPFCLIYKPPMPTTRRQWFDLVLVGFLIQVVYFSTAWMAFAKGGSASTVALITSLQPVLVALIMPLISSENVSRRRWLGLVLGLLGTSLVLFGNAGIQVVSLSVLIFSISALCAFTLATVWEKRYGVSHHPVTANLVQYSVGLAGTLPLAYLFEPMSITVTTPFMLALTYLVLGNSLLAISLLLMMIRRGEATRVSALFFLVPPVSALIAWLVLDEFMSNIAWLGMAVAVVGVWLATRRTTARAVKANHG